jgi:hypothetical protein
MIASVRVSKQFSRADVHKKLSFCPKTTKTVLKQLPKIYRNDYLENYFSTNIQIIV